METFTCQACRMALPTQLLALTYTRAPLCKWCQVEPLAVRGVVTVTSDDDKALTLAQLASWIMSGRTPRKWRAAWVCR